MRKLFTYLVLFSLVLCGCGTHGSISSYEYQYSISELVKKIDSFVKNEKEIRYLKTNPSGWIYTRFLNGYKFGFRISEPINIYAGNIREVKKKSEIVLIAAGTNETGTKWSGNIGFFKEIMFENFFHENFIKPLESINEENNFDEVVTCPFLSSSNIGDRDYYYMMKKDTLIEFQRPVALDSLGYYYFENIVMGYAKANNLKIRFNQFYKMFSIDEKYTGIIKDDKILINAFYRHVGEEVKVTTIFEQENWKKYTASENLKNIIDSLKEYKIPYGHTPNDDFSKDYWIVDYIEKYGFGRSSK